MAANPVDYVQVLLRRQISAVASVGVDITQESRELYLTNVSLLVLIGVVMKALNDHGTVLDAEWQTRVNAALAGTWPDWILAQVNPDKPADPGAG
jgi:putative copper export protein